MVKLLAVGDQHDSRRGTFMEFLRLKVCMRGTGELGAQQRPGFRFLSAGSDEALESVGARPDSQLKARPKYWMDWTGYHWWAVPRRGRPPQSSRAEGGGWRAW